MVQATQYDDSIKINKDITLYAQWEEDTVVQITADVTKVENITVSSSSSLTIISTSWWKFTND